MRELEPYNLAALEGNEPPQATPSPAPPTGRALTPLSRTSFEKRKKQHFSGFLQLLLPIYSFILISSVDDLEFCFAAFFGRCDAQSCVYAFFEFWDVGDDAYHAACVLEVDECIHGAVQGVGVEGTEAFVDEHGIKTDAALSGLDDVGKAKGQGQGCQEGFAAGKCIGRAGTSCEAVGDFKRQSALPQSAFVCHAVEGVSPPAHGEKTEVRSIGYVVKECAKDVSFQGDPCLLSACEVIKASYKAFLLAEVFQFLLDGSGV